MSTKMPKAHEWRQEHLRLAISATGAALWAWNVDTDDFTMDEQGFALWALPWRQKVTFEELSAHSILRIATASAPLLPQPGPFLARVRRISAS